MTANAKYVEIPVQDKLTLVANWLADKKGLDVLALDLRALHTFTEGIIIVSAGSIRHAQGLADFVLQESKSAGFEFLRMEGYQAGQWILLDMNDVVISIFQEDARRLYRVEDLWKNASVVLDMRRNEQA